MKTPLRSRRTVSAPPGSTGSDESGHVEAKAAKVPPALWRLLGVLVSVLSMNLLVVQPLLRRQERLEREFLGFRTGVEPLQNVETSSAALRETAELLEAIRLQHRAVVNARATVNQLEQLRREFTQSAERLPEFREALRDLELVRQSLDQLPEEAGPASEPVAVIEEPTPSALTPRDEWRIEIRPQTAPDDSQGIDSPAVDDPDHSHPAAAYGQFSEGGRAGR